jgi:hypothetical protein
MLHLLDQTLEAFLREEVPLPARQIDVSFAAPDQDWGAKLSRPTVNLFLWDVRQNFAERMAGSDLVEENGKKYRRSPSPRVDCRYLVTAWTTEVSDEHQLLGALLVAFLSHAEIGAAHLRGPLASVRPLPTMSVASPAETTSSDFWSAVGGKLKPGLDLLVTAVVDVAAMREAGPPVDQYELRLRKQPGRVPAGAGTLIGGHADAAPGGVVVYGERGAARIKDSGDFVIAARPGDVVEVVEEGAKAPVRATVPKAGLIQVNRKAGGAKEKPAEPKG